MSVVPRYSGIGLRGEHLFVLNWHINPPKGLRTNTKEPTTRRTDFFTKELKTAEKGRKESPQPPLRHKINIAGGAQVHVEAHSVQHNDRKLHKPTLRYPTLPHTLPLYAQGFTVV